MACQSTATISTNSLSVRPFRFMDLVTELRLEVYEYALSGPHEIALPAPQVLEVRKGRHGQRVQPSESPSIRNIGLLLASKRVFTEAMPIFYNMNRFHYTIPPTIPSIQGVLCHFKMRLHLMQHVSIDYVLQTSPSHISEADRLVSTRIRSVINGCSNLRTLTLHLLTFFENEDLDRALPATSQTAVELSRVAARLEDRSYRLEWISLVIHGTSRALMGLRDGIAPANEWVVRLPADWPRISIDEYQKEGMERREDGDTDQRIRMYYLWPAVRRRVERGLRCSSAAKA